MDMVFQLFLIEVRNLLHEYGIAHREDDAFQGCNFFEEGKIVFLLPGYYFHPGMVLLGFHETELNFLGMFVTPIDNQSEYIHGYSETVWLFWVSRWMMSIFPALFR